MAVVLNADCCTACLLSYLCSRFCGRDGPPSLMSTNNVLSIMFVSDHSVTTEGFTASYITINASSGTVTSCHESCCL